MRLALIKRSAAVIPLHTAQMPATRLRLEHCTRCRFVASARSETALTLAMAHHVAEHVKDQPLDAA